MENKRKRPVARIKPEARTQRFRRQAKFELTPVEEPVHLRRCHLCDAVNESQGEVVSRCESCGKFMAPFYFFKESEVVAYSDHDLRPPAPPVEKLSEERLPIRGLTAYW